VRLPSLLLVAAFMHLRVAAFPRAFEICALAWLRIGWCSPAIISGPERSFWIDAHGPSYKTPHIQMFKRISDVFGNTRGNVG